MFFTRIVFLIISILVPLIICKESIYFPVKIKHEKFDEIPLSKLNCPYDIDDTELRNVVKFQGKILTLNQIDVHGKICYKHQITSKCSENFWGKQDYTHAVDHLELSTSEVNKTFENRDLIIPDVKCQWMSDAISVLTEIRCDPAEIKYDESLQIGYTPTFGGFKCDSEKCQIDKHHVFLLDKKRDLTKGYTVAELEFSTTDRQTVTPESFVKSNYFPKTSLLGSCVSGEEVGNKMRYKLITKNGLLIELDHNADKYGDKYTNNNLHEHHNDEDIKHLIGKKFKKNDVWGQIMFNSDGKTRYTWSGQNLDPFHKKFHKILIELRLCQINDFERVRVPALDYDRVMTEMFIESKMDQIECKKNLYRIMMTKKVSNSDLSMLAQNHHGPGVVYKIVGGKLLAAHGAYKKIIWSPNENRIGLDAENNDTVVCPKWENDPENDGVQWCLNGIFRRNNNVYHPVFGGDNMDDLKLIFEEKELKNVDHISLINLKKDSWKEHYNLESTTKFKGFELSFDFFKKIELTILHWAGIGLGLLFLLLLIKKCLQKKNNDHFIP
ncbi:glycoprotein [Bimbo virus]|uniref:Glycoprotein n=1 Tax=Bimbo virus TaxID=864694 RepID=A0AAE8XCI4_9RHAB|nr:glycoprotein [Bimbo virus]UAU42872.1 glycoprotein [Bimbo virus]WAD86855.1 glycoprotein [Bimbo virus]